MMKSSIPSSAGFTRELALAGGGPWWSCASSACAPGPTGCGKLAASIRLGGWSRGRGGLEVDDDVLDGRRGHVLDALDQVRSHPARALVGEGGDDDVVHTEQLERVDGGRVGVGVADHARADQALAVQSV